MKSWNGSSWTETNDLNTARQKLQVDQAHHTAIAIFYGHHSGNNATEIWDGSSWTEVKNKYSKILGS